METMEFNLRRYSSLAELSAFNADATIKEDVSDHDGKIPETQIEEFITIAREMANHNGVSDIDFVYNIFNAFLNDSEREELIKKATTIEQ